MWHVWAKGEVRTGFFLARPERNHLEGLGVDGRIMDLNLLKPNDIYIYVVPQR